MNSISTEKLYNPIYDSLSTLEKQELLNNIAGIYNMDLLCFKEFSAFGESTYTAEFRSKEGIEFVFVPGERVKLGIDFKGRKPSEIFNEENLYDLAYSFIDEYEDETDSQDYITKIKEKLEDNEFISAIEDYLNNNFSKEETILIHPLLVQKDYSETCWKDILDDELKENKEWQTMIENAEQKGISEITVHKSMCLYKENESWHGKVYIETTFKELLQDITDKGYFLPTKREWEYLAGKGCRTIFPWGNNMDFSMKLRHMEWTDNDDEYTLEKENFFGIYIAEDPYCREIVYYDGVFSYKGGDGGRNICGGMGPVWGYFPVSPYFENKDEKTGEYINGGYDFFRRIIRIMKR
ncbi:MAG: hypothetical protein HXK76_04010 [Lachnoanaerobaculum sp.]|nr:hypothetical protein [Lachnoanaerobaculum sp.]